MVQNKIILITGGSGDIGSDCARLLTEKGAKVVINYHQNKAEAEKLAAMINEKYGSDYAISVQADITDEQQIKTMVRQVMEKYGKIDVLINNACPKTFPLSIQDTGWSNFELFISVIVKGSYQLIKEITPLMAERKNGNIINILTAYVAGMPPPKLTPYITAKYALEGLSKSLAAELGPLGIRVNMVSPGLMKNQFTSHLPEKLFELTALQNPLKRITTAKDVAKAVLFLASNDSSFINGLNLLVCGGSITL
ncbi:MAG TPA: SDR family oxidoreductase [Candidatus Nanoarchaeia archaeon]|nr:SDR family oxidoreductase [Candidatus Nanoarchaeia archaeon]